MILKFSLRILQKEWRKLLLPFLSVVLTGMVVATSFFLIDSSRQFIADKNKEFLGGDISFEANNLFNYEDFFDTSKVTKKSDQITFSALLTSGEKSSPASVRVVDNNYPLYGKVEISNASYSYLNENEVYIDKILAENLSVAENGKIIFGESEFIVKGIINSDPQSLISGFNFLGKAIFSRESIAYSKVDLNLFRKEYVTNISINSKLSKAEIAEYRKKLEGSGVRGKFDNSSGGSLQFGLDVVERFLVVAILIIAILSLVNIYASVNYLANRLRRSFAILISLGLDIKNVYRILLLVNFIIIFIGSLFGIILGVFTVSIIQMEVTTIFNVALPKVFSTLEMFFIFLGILGTSIFATLPVVNRIRRISPKELLTHSNQSENKYTTFNIFVDILVGILPITLLSIYFLDSLIYGSLVIATIVSTYGLVMIFYYYFVALVYSYRHYLSFSLKLITAQKKFDGFFGLITFASLFVALTSVYNLSIIRTSIADYLQQDLKSTLPSTYIIDVQNSQKEKLLTNFKDIVLYPNVRARILEIDGKNIVDAIENNEPGVDRELRREFNLTYRSDLIGSEKIYSGTWQGDSAGEVSLEKDFAEKANIKLGSDVVFLIQGFKITAKVTSIREVDTRSGYPFFYFILNEKDIGNFPQTFFGYANYDSEKVNNLTKFLAQNSPNVTVINTANITELVEGLIDVLLLIIFIITIPPLLLSSLLIITILSTVAKDRKRDGARIMSLGKSHTFIRNYYVVESTSTTFLASIAAYLFALALSNFVIVKYLKIDSVVFVDPISFILFSFIIICIILVSIFIWRSGKMSLKEYLNYEENN